MPDAMHVREHDVIVLGGGPAGALAALRAAELGARTALVTAAEFGGMAANDGPVPVRALAFAARLLREAREMPRYGISAGAPGLHYDKLLARVREITHQVSEHSALRERIDALGVTLIEQAGVARFIDRHTIETTSGLRLSASKFILCTGGVGRRPEIPGIEFTHTHSHAWKLEQVPSSMLVVGGGDTGVQVAAVFQAFGSRVQLFERGPRILRGADEAVASAVAAGLRDSGVDLREGFGNVTAFDQTPNGVRMRYRNYGGDAATEAAVIVMASGWVADTGRMNLGEAGVELDARGNVRVDRFLQTTAPHIFAAGDVTGRLMLVPGAIEDGFVAATNALQGPTLPLPHRVTPSGSFTHPEYAEVGLTEAEARETHAIATALVPLDAAVRPIIEGRTFGFCKLVVDRSDCRILGCHVVGERAVEIAQLAAIAMAADMRVDDLARIAISFPTYSEVLVHAAILVAMELGLPLSGQGERVRRDATTN
ncbi:NAD(P)/FAD-dependent oxidoreductase [Lysobacter sp. KIS68-7]|uniref:dihydrolipoyl dehydrogenase family protein n=1 Tax=Lysobacter sp. KIS68-7 TaxID=2904252 RepID=UPI001E2B509F|nr:NAD(P)/FAD-dependent oxidoreductase [Lysobacter sp. KIS68-7]UHQ19388.1 NAD(P)/FAD-dependent oxidoreductase [Lysobacter sp. KIS68-7]